MKCPNVLWEVRLATDEEIFSSFTTANIPYIFIYGTTQASNKEEDYDETQEVSHTRKANYIKKKS